MWIFTVWTLLFFRIMPSLGAFKITRTDDSNLCSPNSGDTIKVFLQVSTSPGLSGPVTLVRP